MTYTVSFDIEDDGGYRTFYFDNQESLMDFIEDVQNRMYGTVTLDIIPSTDIEIIDW